MHIYIYIQILEMSGVTQLAQILLRSVQKASLSAMHILFFLNISQYLLLSLNVTRHKICVSHEKSWDKHYLQVVLTIYNPFKIDFRKGMDSYLIMPWVLQKYAYDYICILLYLLKSNISYVWSFLSKLLYLVVSVYTYICINGADIICCISYRPFSFMKSATSDILYQVFLTI